MDISTKYNIGDELFLIRREVIETGVKCSFCSEVGRIRGDDKTNADCPRCRGLGWFRDEKEGNWVVADDIFTVNYIKVSKDDICYIEYSCPYAQCVSEQDLFLTSQGAYDECAERNLHKP